MITSKTSDIFRYLSTQEIPPVISIPFCLRLLGIKTNDLHKSMGVSRSLLYQVLAGNRKPNERIKQKLEELGISPWKNKEKANKSPEPTADYRAAT